MPKKATTTAVATVTGNGITIPKTKKEVSTTIEELKVLLKELTGEDDEKKIDLEMSYDEVKIKDMTKVTDLLKVSSSVSLQEELYKKEIKRYQLENLNIKPFELDNRTIDVWQKAISIKIKQVINESQIASIKTAIEQLSKHLSEQEQLAKTLETITSKVGAYIE